jgi:hypothetical protein
MSNSYKKTPICGHTTAESEKMDKRLANRRFRRTVRQQLGGVAIGDDADSVITDIRAVSNVWAFDKDGKQFLDNPDPKDLRK